MSLTFEPYRGLFVDLFFTEELTLPAGATLADGTVLSEPTAVLGSFTPRNGSFSAQSSQAQPDLRLERGSYQIELPVGTLVEPNAKIRYQGRTYVVVWTPPATALDLSQVYGVEERR